LIEPALPVRLIALDIDGTLIGDDEILGERTRAAVAEAVKRGIVVALVTGRSATGAARFAAELGIEGPVVGLQGAIIREMPVIGSNRPGRLLHHTPLAAGATTEILAWCEAGGLMPYFFHLDLMILGRSAAYEEQARMFGDRVRFVPSLAERSHRPVTKVVAIGEDGVPARLLAESRARFGDRAQVTVSHSRVMEFMAPGVSKGAAIRWLARRNRVPLANCMAIGDQHADLEMIAEVGHGVAMPTAPAEVREAARFVAPPLAEEGSAQMIERIALAGPGPALVHPHRGDR
jgi:Cof subfamily protein (haloacid dehalogenase superfamily)